MTTISYHTWYNFRSDLNCKVRTKEIRNTYKLAECFDIFWKDFSYDGYFVFGWDAVPEYIDEIIDSFNSTFKNIKVVLLDSQPVYYYRNSFFEKSSAGKTNAKSIMLSVILNEEYNPICKKYLYYIIHHLFRFLSLSEDAYHINNCSYTFIQKNKERDFCKLVSNINDYWIFFNYKYRGVDYAFTPENVLLLDNISLCNDVFASFYPAIKKQTNILFSLLYNSPTFKPISMKDVINSYKEKVLKVGNGGMKVRIFSLKGGEGIIKGIYVVSSDFNNENNAYLKQLFLYTTKSSYNSFKVVIETPDRLVISDLYNLEFIK